MDGGHVCDTKVAESHPSAATTLSLRPFPCYHRKWPALKKELGQTRTKQMTLSSEIPRHTPISTTQDCNQGPDFWQTANMFSLCRVCTSENRAISETLCVWHMGSCPRWLKAEEHVAGFFGEVLPKQKPPGPALRELSPSNAARTESSSSPQEAAEKVSQSLRHHGPILKPRPKI